MNNNAVVASVVGIIVIIIGFVAISMMNDDTVVIPVTQAPATSTSGVQTEQEKAAALEVARIEREAQQVAFSINVSKLPEAQQVALQVLGINSTSSLDITNKMVSCAGVDMSATRMAEIKGGASVTAGEGVKLVSCYKANVNQN